MHHEVVLPEIRPSLNSTVPLRKGDRLLSNIKGAAFYFRYTTAPTTRALSDITEHTAVIGALSRLDADCLLNKSIRKAGRYLHAVLEVTRLR
jgi:hypothetical protein